MPTDAREDDIGRAVCQALEASREQSRDAPPYDPDADEKLAGVFGLKSKRGLFPGMKLVWIELRNAEITFQPSRAERGGGFSGFPDHWRDKEDVVVPFSSSGAEIGAAARLALSRSSA